MLSPFAVEGRPPRAPKTSSLFGNRTRGIFRFLFWEESLHGGYLGSATGSKWRCRLPICGACQGCENMSLIASIRVRSRLFPLYSHPSKNDRMYTIVRTAYSNQGWQYYRTQRPHYHDNRRILRDVIQRKCCLFVFVLPVSDLFQVHGVYFWSAATFRPTCPCAVVDGPLASGVEFRLERPILVESI